MSQSIGERIRKYRKMAGMSQHELADAIDISLMSIRRYENGDRQPHLEQLKKIADVLGINYLQLTGDINENGNLVVHLLESNKKIRIPKGYSFTPEKNGATADISNISSDDSEIEKEYVIKLNTQFDLNNPYNISLRKLKNKEPLTDEEIELIQNTWNSESFKQQIAKLPEKVDELSKRLKANYDLLNEKGKEKALEQVELLTKIPEYRKDNK